MNHHLLPEVFSTDDIGMPSSANLSQSINIKKKVPSKLAPVSMAAVMDDDIEQSYGGSMIDRASKSIGQPGKRKHGQLAPMSFN